MFLIFAFFKIFKNRRYIPLRTGGDELALKIEILKKISRRRATGYPLSNRLKNGAPPSREIVFRKENCRKTAKNAEVCSPCHRPLTPVVIGVSGIAARERGEKIRVD